MELPSGLLDHESLMLAIDEERYAPPTLLPVGVVGKILRHHRDEVADILLAQLSTSFTPAPQEVVAVSKARHGVRPVAVMDLATRIAYRALVSRNSSLFT
jgi:RNA-directed DNA polymerase